MKSLSLISSDIYHQDQAKWLNQSNGNLW